MQKKDWLGTKEEIFSARYQYQHVDNVKFILSTLQS